MDFSLDDLLSSQCRPSKPNENKKAQNDVNYDDMFSGWDPKKSSNRKPDFMEFERNSAKLGLKIDDKMMDFDLDGSLSKFDINFDDLDVPMVSKSARQEKTKLFDGPTNNSSPVKSFSSGFTSFTQSQERAQVETDVQAQKGEFSSILRRQESQKIEESGFMRVEKQETPIVVEKKTSMEHPVADDASLSLEEAQKSIQISEPEALTHNLDGISKTLGEKEFVCSEVEIPSKAPANTHDSSTSEKGVLGDALLEKGSSPNAEFRSDFSGEDSHGQIISLQPQKPTGSKHRKHVNNAEINCDHPSLETPLVADKKDLQRKARESPVLSNTIAEKAIPGQVEKELVKTGDEEKRLPIPALRKLTTLTGPRSNQTGPLLGKRKELSKGIGTLTMSVPLKKPLNLPHKLPPVIRPSITRPAMASKFLSSSALSNKRISSLPAGSSLRKPSLLHRVDFKKHQSTLTKQDEKLNDSPRTCTDLSLKKRIEDAIANPMAVDESMYAELKKINEDAQQLLMRAMIANNLLQMMDSSMVEGQMEFISRILDEREQRGK